VKAMKLKKFLTVIKNY